MSESKTNQIDSYIRSMIRNSIADRFVGTSRKFCEAIHVHFFGAHDESDVDALKLEPRVLYSATPAPIDVGLIDSPTDGSVDLGDASIDAIEQMESLLAAEAVLPSASTDASSSLQLTESTKSEEASDRPRELLIVDSSLDDLDQLLAEYELDGTRDFEILYLDENANGIFQIDNFFQSNEEVFDAVHLVTHGTAGEIAFGNVNLSIDNFGQYSEIIAGWSSDLAVGSDFLIYGCDVAASQSGVDLLIEISELINVDIAASSDLTGHTNLGGNWEFEFIVGTVETQIAFSTEIQHNWNSILDITSGLVVQNSFDVDASDSSGNGRDGTLIGGAAIDTTAATNLIGDGKVSLDGTNDLVDLSAHASAFDGLSEGTISAWFYLDTLDAAGQTVFSASDQSDGFSLVDIVAQDDELIFGVYENGIGILEFGTTTLDLQVGQWYHVAVTVDGSGNQFYVNGIQQTVTYGTGNAATQAFFSNVNDIDSVLWGASRDDVSAFSFLDGFIDEGRVYDRALSSNDVLGLYNEQFGPITVDTTNDLVDGTTTDVASLLANRGSDGLISLREAILAVNNDAWDGWSIELGAGNFNLTSGSGDGLGDFNIRNDVTIVGAGIGSTVIDGNLSGRLFEVIGANVTFESLTLQEGGGGFDQGGAIAIDAASDVTVNHAQFFGNELSFTDGGAIHNQGTLTVNSSFFDSNQAGSGGAILNTGTLTVTETRFDGNSASNVGGGAISNSGNLTIVGSTFDSNIASNADGGAIITMGTATTVIENSLFVNNFTFNSEAGALSLDGTATITNSTFSSNFGSNLQVAAVNVLGDVTLQNVTITQNNGSSSGAVGVANGATLNIGNTIIAGNTGTFANDLEVGLGTINDLGNNLIGDGSGQSTLVDGVNGNQVGTSGSPIDPMLGALADNGGPTLTHALLTGSSAIDAGNNSAAPTTDQRGVTRDSLVDIGAFEFNATPAAAPDDLVATATRDGGLNINRDGGNDVFLSVDDSSFFAGSQVTIEFQISDLQNTGTSSTLFSNVTGSGSADFKILSDGRLSFIGFNTTSTYTQLFDGNDHSVAFSYDGGTGEIRYYVDGQFVESLAGPMGTLAGGDLIFGQDQDTLGGAYDANETFSGSFRDIRVFSDIRTDAEISASYRSSLPFDEAGLVANWRFDGVSTENVLFDSVTGNQLTVEHISQSGFTGSSAEFDFRVDENAVDGTVIGTITGIDQEREALIASLLAADPQLVYSAATDKFYKAVLTPSDFSAASSAALSTQLNSVNGQLVTIRSAAEQAIIADIAATANASFWLGATDTSNEGEFRWQEAGQDADLFWSGGSGGYNVDGAYTNWPNAIQPDNFGGDQDGLRILANGVWDDVQLTDASLNYIVEWNADDVLDVSQALNYSIESQSVAGAFEIDADNGQLRVADGTLLDADTLATHSVTVRVTDNSGQFRDEIFTISLNDLVEDNNAPTDLSSGIELNLDGGNDAYLLADDGGALLGGLTSVTLEATFSLDSLNFGQSTILSYYTDRDAVGLQVLSSGNLGLEINRQIFDVTVPGGLVLGESYSFAATWDANGNVAIYLDGELLQSSTGFQTGYNIAAGGELVLGQDQDFLLGGFGTNDTFSGTLYDVRIWDEVRSASEISLNYQHKFDGGSLPTGLIANWQFDGFDGSNQVVDVVSGNNLSIGHAAGAGFTTSTPVDDLNISENATNGESVGFVLPSDPDSPQDVVDDGLFLAESPGRYAQGQSIGQWTVLSGDVDLAGDSETPGGGQYLELSGLTPGSIGQTLTTEAGRQYQVVFAFSGQFDGGEITKDLRISADGSSQDFSVIEPAGWTASDFVWDTRSFTFTAEDSSTELSFASLDNSDFGPVIADVRVIEIPQAVTTILNSDPGLAYDAATDKFYRVVTAITDAATATSNAGADSISGVGGQLVTIRSQYENDFIYSLIQPHSGLEFYTGGTDATVEGQWNWIDDGVEADRFWDGNGATGSSPSGAYSNFGNLGDPDGGTAENHLAIRASDGAWLDTDGGATNAYIVEWDASEVLSNFTFELTNDAGGRFAVDANTGEVTVADGSQIDFETAASHDVTVEVTDAGGNSYSETITIAVSDVNESPSVVTNAGAAVAEGQSVTLTSANLQVNDADAADGPSEITFTIANVQNGQLELTSAPGVAVTSFTQAQINSGEVIFQHDDSETSTASFEFSAADGGEDGATAATGTFNLSVTGVNDAPTTTPVTLTSIAEDSGTRVITQAELLANASDVEGNALTVTNLSISSGSGRLFDNGDGTWSFIPAANDDTAVSFSYSISDGTDTVAGSASLDITPVNDGPIAIDDPESFDSLVTDLGALTYLRFGESSGTTATDSGSLSNDGVYNGVTLAGPGAIVGDSDTSAQFDGAADYVEIPHDPAYELVNGTVQLWFNTDDASVEQGLFSKDHTGLGSGGHITLRILDNGAIDLRLQSDTTSHDVRSDAGSVTSGTWHHVAISFGDQGLQLFLDGALVDTNNYDGGLASPGGANTQPWIIGGDTRFSSAGSPNDIQNFFDGSIDEFAVFDSQLSAAQVQQLYVAAQVPVEVVVSEDGVSNFTAANGVLVNDLDIEGDALTVTEVNGIAGDVGNPVTLSSGAILTLNSDGSYSYDPNGQFEYLAVGQSVTDSFSYTVSDGTASDTASVTVTITGANDGPASTPVTLTSIAEDSGTRVITQAELLANANDVDGDTLTATGLTITSGSGTLVDNGDGTFSYTPAANDDTDVSFSYTITDGADNVAGSATLDITPVNDEEVLVTNAGAMVAEGSSGNAITAALLETADVDNSDSELIYVVNSVTNNGTLRLNGSALSNGQSFTQADIDAGNLTYDHDGSQTSADSFDFTVDDGSGTATSATFNFTITNVNDAPVNAVPGAQSVNEDNSVAITGISVADDDDNLSTVRLTVNNGALNVTLSGGATVSAGANDSGDLTLSGSLADINATLASVSYQGNLHFNGSDTLTVLSTDSNAATDSDTIAITVSAVNDDPFNGGSLPSDVTVTEDVLSNVDLSAVDFGDVDAGGSNLTVTLSTSTGGELTLAADGSLTFGGTASSRTITGSLADLNAYFNSGSNIQYQHGTAHTFGDNADTITVVINDNGSTGSGGGSDQTLGTVNVDIIAVNDEEVLATNAGATVAEGSTGTVITTAMLHTTDVDNSDAELVYTVDAVTINGTLRLGGTALGVNDTFTQADIDAGNLTYDHDGSQTSADSFDFTVDDGSGTATSATFNFTITNVNDAPVNAVPGAQSVNEDNSVAITGISVADDDDNLSTVRLTVNNGALNVTLSGGATVSAGANDSGDLTLSGSLADINATLASVSYQGNLHFNGSDTLTVLSTDSNAATDSDTIAITVSAVNDDPFNGGSLPSDVTVTEDVLSNVDLSAVDFGDVDAGGSNLTVTLSTSTGGELTLAADGSLTFGGTASSRTITGSLADLNAYFNSGSNIQYQHGTAHTFGDNADTITVVINDNGSTGSGGGSDQTLGTVNVDIIAVNDEEVLATNAGATVAEGSTGTVITTAMLHTTDVDNSDAELVYTVDAVTINGTLRLGGTALGVNDTFTQADIDAGNLTYDHDGSQTSADSFDFTVDDGSGTATSATFNFTITNVNDAPVNAVPGAQSVNEDNSVAITGISVADDDDNLSTVRLTVNNGALNVTLSGGATVSAGANDSGDLTLSGSLADINATLASVSYQGNLHFNGSDTLTVLSTDSNAATDSDTIAITVSAVNDDPFNGGSLPSDVTVTEDVLSNVDLSAVDFGDVDAGGSNLTVTLSTSTGGELTLAADGSLTFGGTASSRTITGSLADLNAYFNSGSNIQYQHGTAHTFGDNADTITVVINDNGSTGSGGGSDQTLGTVNVDIIAVNDEEVLATNAGATVAEGSTGTVITTAMLHTTDVDNSDAELVYTVDAVTINGTLRLGGTALGVNDTFTQADIDAGNLTYDHDGSQTSADSFDFTVDDGSGTATSATFNFTITNVNDAPVNAVPGAQSVNEDNSVAITGISVADDDDNLSTVRLTVNNGALNVTLSGGATVSAGANDSGDLTLSGSLADINATLASVSYQGNLHFNGSDTLTVLSTDSNAATDSDTIAITVSAVNDDPFNGGSLPSDVTVTEDVLSNVDLSAVDFGDVDAGGSNLTVTLSTSTGGELTLAADGSLTFGGTASSRTITGSLADLNAYFNSGSNIQYQHGTAHTFGDNADTITVVINDNGSTGSGGGSDQTLGTVNVDIIAVNDEEVLATNAGATVAEGSTGTVITTAMLHTTDVDNSDAELVYTVDAVTINGTLRLGGTALGVNDTFTQADIDAGNLTYDHDGSQTSADSFDFTVDDGSGTATSATFNFTITNVNDAPVNAVPGAQSVNEDNSVAITGISVADDDDNLSTVRLTVNNGALNVTLSGGATVSAGANDSGDLTLSGSLADINATLASVSYQGNLHFNGSDTLTVLSTDSNAATDSDTIAITVSAVNDDPFNGGSLPSDVTVTEDVLSNVDLSAVDFGDVDAGGSNLTVTLSTSTGGELTLAADGSLTFGGTASSRTITGSLADLNAYFDNASSIQYLHGIEHLSGDNADTITVVINDNGNTGSGGGADQTIGTINVDITNVNDAPTLIDSANVNLPGTTEDTASTGTSVASIYSAVGGADVDLTPQTGIAVVSTSGSGTWQYSTDGTNWTNFGPVSNGSALVLSSTSEVRYLPDGIDGEVATFAFVGWDETVSAPSTFGSPSNVDIAGAQGGSNEFSAESATATISVTAVNDAVVATSDTGTAQESGGVNNASAGTNATGNVLANDIEVDPLDSPDVTGVVAGVSSSANSSVGSGVAGTYGTITISANGDYSYVVDENNSVVQSLRTGIDTLTDTFTYSVTDDGGATSTTQIVITISGQNDAPRDLDTTGLSIQENSAINSVAGAITASDVDSGDSAIFRLVDDANGRFAIDSSTGVVTVADGTQLNFENDVSHTIRVEVEDALGATYQEDFIVNILDENEFATSSPIDSDSAINEVNENAAVNTTVGVTGLATDADGSNNTITYDLTDDADGRFQIDSSTGIVSVLDGTLLDRETAASHDVIIRAMSSDGSIAFETFTINLLDVDEFDVSNATDADSNANLISEHASSGDAVGITASANDADATQSDVTYSLVDNAGGRFGIDSVTGVVSVVDETLLDFETNEFHEIVVRAQSSDGSFDESNFRIDLSDVDEYDVTISIDSDVSDNSVDENSIAGTFVGLTVFAEDLDGSNDTVTYQLVDDANGAFVIDPNTGVVTVSGNVQLDFEISGNQIITVSAMSADGSTSQSTYSIAINDINDRPVAFDNNYSTNFVSDAADPNGVLFNDTDQDNDSLTAVLVTNVSTGTLIFNADGSFTYTPESGFVGTVEFTYLATDGTLDSNIATVTIEVTLPEVNLQNSSTGDGTNTSSGSQGDESSSDSSVNDNFDAESDTDFQENDVQDELKSVKEEMLEEQLSQASDLTVAEQAAEAAEAIASTNGEYDSSADDDVVIGARTQSRSEGANSANVRSRDFDRFDARGLQANSDGLLQYEYASSSRFQSAVGRLINNVSNQDLTFELDLIETIQPQDDEALVYEELVTNTVIGTGVVIWVLQAAHIAATLMSTVPAWMNLDPLNVIDEGTDDDIDEDDDDHSAELFSFDRKTS